jgi:hypothetical protein
MRYANQNGPLECKAAQEAMQHHIYAGMGNEGDEQQEINNEHDAQANVQLNNLDPPADDLLLDDDEREELLQQQQPQLLLKQLLQQQQPCQHEDQQYENQEEQQEPLQEPQQPPHQPPPPPQQLQHKIPVPNLRNGRRPYHTMGTSGSK